MTESLQQEIRALRSLFWSERDPEGRVFAPLADAYRRAGDFRLAVELLRDGLDRHPGFVAGHLVAAQLFLEKGLLEEAELASRRALELDRDNPLAVEILTATLEAKGAAEEAVRAESPVREPAAMEPEALIRAEAVFDVVALAPEPEPEGDVIEIGALAPEEPEVVEIETSAPAEAVFDVAALAPEADAEEDVIEIGALAPEEPGVVEIEVLAPAEAVFDVAALAPEAEAERDVIEIEALAPDEPEVVELEALAPDEPAPEEPAFDVVGLAVVDGSFANALPTDELADEFPLVTRTMAELYARQGLTDQALEVYRQLLETSPDDADLRRRVDALRGSGSAVPADAPVPEEPASELRGPVADEEHLDHAWASGALAERHDVDTPFAWTARDDSDETPSSGPPISGYFSRMLRWVPGGGGGADGATPFRRDT